MNKKGLSHGHHVRQSLHFNIFFFSPMMDTPVAPGISSRCGGIVPFAAPAGAGRVSGLTGAFWGLLL